jgi:acetyltransferase-like isoleucine patch superfamily enzyme
MITLKFSLYSYAEHLLWMFANLLPPVLRTPLLRPFFKRLGAKPLIDYGTYIRYPFKVSIGDNVAINRGCRIYASYQVADAEIIIDDRVVFGPDVKLLGAGHDYETIDLRDTAATIHVCSHVWIGAGSIILPGVTVGEGAIVGAGSIVSRDIPPWSVALGTPAKVIKERKVRPV